MDDIRFMILPLHRSPPVPHRPPFSPPPPVAPPLSPLFTSPPVRRAPTTPPPSRRRPVAPARRRHPLGLLSPRCPRPLLAAPLPHPDTRLPSPAADSPNRRALSSLPSPSNLAGHPAIAPCPSESCAKSLAAIDPIPSPHHRRPAVPLTVAIDPISCRCLSTNVSGSRLPPLDSGIGQAVQPLPRSPDSPSPYGPVLLGLAARRYACCVLRRNLPCFVLAQPSVASRLGMLCGHEDTGSG